MGSGKEKMIEQAKKAAGRYISSGELPHRLIMLCSGDYREKRFLSSLL